MLGAAGLLIQHWIGPARARTLARYELALDATRRPDLRRVLAGTGALLRRSVEAMLGELGVSDPPRQAPLLIAYLDGLVFDQIAVSPPAGSPGVSCARQCSQCCARSPAVETLPSLHQQVPAHRCCLVSQPGRMNRLRSVAAWRSRSSNEAMVAVACSAASRTQQSGIFSPVLALS